MEKFKPLIFILLLLTSCTYMTQSIPEGKFSYFWEPCKDIQGVAIICNKRYVYTKKVRYSPSSIAYFKKKYVFLGHGEDDIKLTKQIQLCVNNKNTIQK